MSELAPLISDLALILICAGVMTLVFKRLKQPLVLGYIVAGFLASPHFTLTPSVIDTASIHTWSEIGVIFFAFRVGLGIQFQEVGEGWGDCCHCGLFHYFLYDYDRNAGGMVFWVEVDGLSLFRGDVGDVFHDHYL